LDETITQLEKQADAFKQNTGVLSKIAELSDKIDKSLALLFIANQSLDSTKKDLKDSLTFLKSEVSELKKLVENKIDELISANKKFNRDLEESVNSKITKFSSDIQVTIRDEIKQMQRSMEVLIKENFLNLEEKISKKILKAQRLQLALIICSTILLLVSILLAKLL